MEKAIFYGQKIPSPGDSHKLLIEGHLEHPIDNIIVTNTRGSCEP